MLPALECKYSDANNKNQMRTSLDTTSVGMLTKDKKSYLINEVLGWTHTCYSNTREAVTGLLLFKAMGEGGGQLSVDILWIKHLRTPQRTQESAACYFTFYWPT